MMQTLYVAEKLIYQSTNAHTNTFTIPKQTHLKLMYSYRKDLHVLTVDCKNDECLILILNVICFFV